MKRLNYCSIIILICTITKFLHGDINLHKKCIKLLTNIKNKHPETQGDIYQTIDLIDKMKQTIDQQITLIHDHTVKKTDNEKQITRQDTTIKQMEQENLQLNQKITALTSVIETIQKEMISMHEDLKEKKALLEYYETRNKELETLDSKQTGLDKKTTTTLLAS